jgi:hypothetical protein
VAYAKVDGRGVIFISTPAFFLWALDAETGRPLENWGGKPVRSKVSEERRDRYDSGPRRRLGPVEGLEG